MAEADRSSAVERRGELEDEEGGLEQDEDADENVSECGSEVVEEAEDADE